MEKKSWTQKSTLIFLAACVAGAATLFWSAADWYQLMSGLRQSTSFCSVSQYWDCDRATMSVYGSFASIPVGIFGAIWFLLIGFLTLGTERFRFLVKVLFGIGALGAIFLASVLIFKLKTGCVVCFFSDLCILVAILSGSKVLSRSGSLISPALVSLLLGVSLLGVATFTGIQMARIDGNIPVAEFDAWFKTLPSSDVKAVSPLSKGHPGAKIQVIEFSDFGCPFCALAAGILLPYLELQPDVEIHFVPFPLDSSCNPMVNRTVHAGSCDWSKAVLCAQEQNKAWLVHDSIFRMVRNDGALPPVAEAAKLFGLDRAKFEACLASEQVNTSLRQLIELANQLNVSSTPTFVVNNRLLRGFIPMPLLRRVLAEMRREP